MILFLSLFPERVSNKSSPLSSQADGNDEREVGGGRWGKYDMDETGIGGEVHEAGAGKKSIQLLFIHSPSAF